MKPEEVFALVVIAVLLAVIAAFIIVRYHRATRILDTMVDIIAERQEFIEARAAAARAREAAVVPADIGNRNGEEAE